MNNQLTRDRISTCLKYANDTKKNKLKGSTLMKHRVTIRALNIEDFVQLPVNVSRVYNVIEMLHSLIFSWKSR